MLWYDAPNGKKQVIICWRSGKQSSNPWSKNKPVRRTIENNGSVQLAYDSFEPINDRAKVETDSVTDYVRGLIIAAAYTGLPLEDFEELMKSGGICNFLPTNKRLLIRNSNGNVNQDRYLFLFDELNEIW